MITSYTPSILYSIWLIGKMPEGQNRKFNMRKVECDGSSTKRRSTMQKIEVQKVDICKLQFPHSQILGLGIRNSNLGWDRGAALGYVPLGLPLLYRQVECLGTSTMRSETFQRFDLLEINLV